MSAYSAQLLTSSSNPFVKQAAKLHGRKGRKDQNRFLVEGPRAIRDGIGHLEELFVTPAAQGAHADMIDEIAAQGTIIRLVTEDVMAVLSDTVGPPGLIGVAPIPDVRIEEVLHAKPRLVIVLDKVRDPGNAGTIIRTADAAGADAVVLMHHSSDPYNPKTVRSTAGSIFHIPVVVGQTSDVITQLQAGGLQALSAHVHEGDSLYNQDLTRPTALVFGGEAEGLSAGTEALCDIAVTIPMSKPQRPGYSGHAESLNLAAACAIMTFAVAQAQQGIGFTQPFGA